MCSCNVQEYDNRTKENGGNRRNKSIRDAKKSSEKKKIMLQNVATLHIFAERNKLTFKQNTFNCKWQKSNNAVFGECSCYLEESLTSYLLYKRKNGTEFYVKIC